MKLKIKSANWMKREEKTPRNSKKRQKRLKRNKLVLRELQDDMKHNIHIIGIPEGGEEILGIENLFEKVMTENFPNLMREKSHKSRKLRESQSRGTQRGPLQDTS